MRLVDLMCKCNLQRYPLCGEELYVLCHVNEELANHSIELERYNEALNQLHKAHECVIDISSTDEEHGQIISHSKLSSYIKGEGCW